MSKPLDDAAIARAMREAARIAASGTLEQRAGMFRPAPARALAAKAAAPRTVTRRARSVD